MAPVVRARLTAVVVIAVVAGCAATFWRLMPDRLGDLPPPPVEPSATDTPAIHATLPPRPSEAFVGSAVCAECHADICREYAGNPMGRSLSAIAKAEPIEDYGPDAHFDAPPSPGSELTVKYSVERDADGVRHHEIAVDAQGNIVYDQGEAVQYAVGSGQRGRSYLTNRDGLLYMSPTTWYSQKSRWNLSPGYNVYNYRFERRILDGCIVCHAGRLDVIPDRPNCYRSNPFLEEVIGCERCHGPARDHVAYQRDGVDRSGPDRQPGTAGTSKAGQRLLPVSSGGGGPDCPLWSLRL